MTAEDQPTNDYDSDPDATRLLLRSDLPSGLASGVQLREFEIERVIAEGGFGIVYGALDLNLHRRVALKEYMPAALAARRGDRTVQPRNAQDRETFDLGRRSFVNEARLLARFDHPALVKVHQFWEENGTAYMVMPLYQGRTLKQWLKDRAQPPTEEELKALLVPLLDALEHLHAENVFHRDVAPDNILLLNDGSPVLLDFGAARHVLADSTKALTAILKPSYAPIEQYADMAQLRQGPWTDAYALCAVLYFAVTGATPPSAVARSISDRMVPAAKAAAGRYSARFLRGIDVGLAVRPEARPQSIAELRRLLLASAPSTAKGALPSDGLAPAVARTRLSGFRVTAAGVGTLVVAVGIWWVTAPASGPPPVVPERGAGQTPPVPSKSATTGSVPTGMTPDDSTNGSAPPVGESATAIPVTTAPADTVVPGAAFAPSPASRNAVAGSGSAPAARKPTPKAPVTEASAAANAKGAAAVAPSPSAPNLPAANAPIVAAPARPAGRDTLATPWQDRSMLPLPPVTGRDGSNAGGDGLGLDLRRNDPLLRAPRDSAPRFDREVGRARCLRIVQRMQLGELPTAEEKSYLKKECT